MIHGIDVANYQSSTYSTTGQSFVFVKATEGSSYVNPKYRDQLAHGRAKGLVIGHYHFEHHGNVQSQVDYFIRHADVRPGEIIALDWEQRGLNTSDKDAWLRAVKKHYPNNKVVLYTYTSMWKGVDTSSFVQDGLWIADPNHDAGHPAITHPWVFHQYSSANNLDRNVAKFDSLAELRTWAGTKPKPTPVYAPFPGDKYFFYGRTSKLVTEVGRALVRAGYKGYKIGPTPVFGPADRRGIKWFQEHHHELSGDADGHFGPLTWKMLKVRPPK
jgi:hypothetical protein